MKIRKVKRLDKGKRVILTIFIVVSLILALTIFEITGITHFINNPKSPTPEQIKEAKTDADNKQKYIESNSNKTNANSSTTPTAPTSSDISVSTRRETDGSVTISTQLSNYSDGTCDLSITNGTNTYVQSATIIYQTSFSTCAGFNIPTSSLGLGTWKITLNVTSKGVTNTNTASMEVQ